MFALQQTTTHSARTVALGNPLKLAIDLAIKNTGLWDAFEFTDRQGLTIRCERAETMYRGKHWRIYHGDTFTVIKYNDQASRVAAARKVHVYLMKHALWYTKIMRGDSALDYWQDKSAKKVVVL